MQTTIMLSFAKLAYAKILRGLILKAIDNPDETWDDDVLKVLDTIFAYKEDVR